MGNLIKGVAKLQGTATLEKLQKLEFSAKLHKQHSNIDFKILSVHEFEVVIEVRQRKAPNGIHFEANRLIEIAKEWLDPYVSQIVHARPRPYTVPIVDMVDSEWILKKMHQLRVPLKVICIETGVDKTTMSAYINGLKPLSQTVKSMFFYYFGLKEIGGLFESKYNSTSGASTYFLNVIPNSIIEEYRIKMERETGKQHEIVEHSEGYTVKEKAQ